VTEKPINRLWKITAVLLLLTGCKGLEAGAATGGCLSGEAAASNTPATGTLAAPKGLTRFEFSAPPGTNFALCVW
jgi:hypothetical protein